MGRVLSGMRPTGSLHLGHLCGVLANWAQLQSRHQCYFFVADWHALTTEYATPPNLTALNHEIVITWLSAGIDPKQAVIFVQSDVPEHAELHLLLSMVCPLSWLTQLPTYKAQKINLQKNIDTYGFLGYPLLQSADIMAYDADIVPVGEDQLPHIEFTREVARRINHLYGKNDSFQTAIKNILKKLPQAISSQLTDAIHAYRQDGNSDTMLSTLNKIAEDGLSPKETSLLRGYGLYDAEEILVAPQSLLTSAPKLLGTDGRKMSKSYNNTIDLFDTPPTIQKKIATMQTDPARQKRTDKGTPQKCPVWNLHQQFSTTPQQQWVENGCTTAGIGCVDCKKTLSQNIIAKLEPLQEKRQHYEKQGIVADILSDGANNAKQIATNTLNKVKHAMRITT